MNVGIGNESTQFHFWKQDFRYSGAQKTPMHHYLVLCEFQLMEADGGGECHCARVTERQSFVQAAVQYFYIKQAPLKMISKKDGLLSTSSIFFVAQRHPLPQHKNTKKIDRNQLILILKIPYIKPYYKSLSAFIVYKPRIIVFFPARQIKSLSNKFS